MKDVKTYICMFLMIMGICANAWGTKLTYSPSSLSFNAVLDGDEVTTTPQSLSVTTDEVYSSVYFTDAENEKYTSIHWEHVSGSEIVYDVDVKASFDFYGHYTDEKYIVFSSLTAIPASISITAIYTGTEQINLIAQEYDQYGGYVRTTRIPITITVSEPGTPHNITYRYPDCASNKPSNENNVAAGSHSLPTNVNVDGYTFAGWTENGSYADGTSAPTTLYKSSFTMPGDRDVELYAVYSKSQNVSANTITWSHYTEEIVTNGNYVISNGQYATGAGTNIMMDNSMAARGNRIAAKSVTMTGSKISSDVVSVAWQFQKDGDYYTIYNPYVKKYVAATVNEKEAVLVDSPSDAARWSITKSSSTYNIISKSREEASETAKYLKYNSQSNAWACYSSNSAIYLYVTDVNPFEGSTTYTIDPKCTTYSVTYDANGGTGSVPTDATKYTQGAKAIVLGNVNGLTKDGYAFAGWATSSSATSATYHSGSELTIGTSDVTLYAVWSQVVTITYKDQGNVDCTAENIDDLPTEHVTGGGNTVLVAGTKTNYYFRGWYYTSACTGDAVTEVPSARNTNLTLYAKWEAMYTEYRWKCPSATDVTFDPMGGTFLGGGTECAKVIEVGSNEPCCGNPEKTGYTFTGWYESETDGKLVFATDGTMQGNTNYTDASGNWKSTDAEVTVYAHWTAIVYDITYNLDGGTNGANPATYTIETADITLQDASKDGYSFDGWYTESTLENKVEGVAIATSSTGDKEFWAKWSVNSYDINCEIWNGGVKLQDCEGVANVTYGTANVDVEVSAACITGYTISSWTITPTTAYTSVNDRTISITSMPASNITVKVNVTPAQYTITLDKNNGVEDKIVTATYLSSSLSPANFGQTTRAGYTIGGYTTVADGSVLVIGTDKKLVANVDGYTDAEGRWTRAENTKLYAKWVPNTRNITYYDGDAVYTGTFASEPHPTTYLEGIGCDLVNAVKTGYTFVGWYRNSDLSGSKTTSIGTSITGDQTFYAKWTANNYTIVLDANYAGATDANNGSITVTYGTRTVVNYKAATRTGYTLKPTNAYNTTQGGGGTYIVTDGGVLTENNHGSWLAGDDHHWVATGGTLYAQWNKNKYNLTWVTDGDALTGSYTKGSVYYEADITAPNTPTKTGYIFAGWDVAVPAKMPANDVTLTATWTPISYTVVYDGNGNTGGSMTNQSFNYDQSKALLTNNFTKQGSAFLGWSTVKDGEKVYDDREVVSNLTATAGATVTLYAKWELQFGTMTISGDVHLSTGNGIQVYTTTEANNLITLSCDNLGAANSFKIEYLDESDNVVEKGNSLFRLCYAPGNDQGKGEYNVADAQNIPLSQVEKDAVSYSRKFAISYTPNAAGVTNVEKLRLTAMTSGNAELASATITLYGRSLPGEFVIATKVDGNWYALRSDLSASSSNSTAMQGAKIEVDNTTTPTMATYAPQNTRYTAAARNAANSYRGGVRLQSLMTNGYLQATESNAADIWLPTTNNTKGMQDWYLSSTNFGVYNIDLYPTDVTDYGRHLSVYGGAIGWYTTIAKDFYLLPIDPETEFGPMLDIVDWSTSAVTVNMSSSTRTLTMGEVIKTKAQRETDRTMVLTSASTLNAGDLVLISGVNATSSALETKHKYKVPYICAGSTTISAKTGFDGSTTLYVKDGVTTVSAQIEIAKVIVCPGAALNVTGRIRCGELIIRTTPWESGAVEGSVVALNTYYTRIIDKQDAYYHFALPYESNVDNVFLSNRANIPYGNTWILKSYDGARRATAGADRENWTLLDGTSNKTIAATTGYEMFSNSAYYREFYFPVTPTDNKDVSLTAYKGSAGEIHEGWNAVCSPIMSNYRPSFNNPSEALKISELVDQDVYWQHIPTLIAPAIPFYVQVAEDKTLTFGAEKWNAPAHLAAKAQATEQVDEQWLQVNYTPESGRGDETNIFVHPDFTPDYETEKDVAKQTLSSKYPSIYVQLACGNLAFAAIPDEMATTKIPLTVYAPAAQTMTFSLTENDFMGRLKSIYLVDEQTGSMTDLLMSNYRYEAEAGTTSGRFYLVAEFNAPGTTSEVENSYETETMMPKKVIVDDKLFIIVGEKVYDGTGKLVNK